MKLYCRNIVGVNKNGLEGIVYRSKGVEHCWCMESRGTEYCWCIQKWDREYCVHNHEVQNAVGVNKKGIENIVGVWNQKCRTFWCK